MKILDASIILLVFLWLVGESLIFAEEPKARDRAEMSVEDIVFYSQPGLSGKEPLKRKGLLFRNNRPGTRATVLMAHGYSCNKEDIRFMSMIFSEYHVVVFDFRAHGELSAGQCCTFGSDEAYDIKAAVEFIRADPQLKKLPIVSWAFSMGAVASIEAQARFGKLFDCAVWDCPFDSTEELIARAIEHLKITVLGHSFRIPGRSFLLKYAYHPWVQGGLKMALRTIANIDASLVPTRLVPIDVVASAQKITIPVFFVTCQKDTKAPPAAVRNICDAVPGFTRFWITEGEYHFRSFFQNPEKYRRKVLHFIENFLDGTLSQKVQKKVWIDEGLVRKSGEKGAVPVKSIK
ncbi:MAG: Hydrolase of the alpha/beta superfamily [candidate division TM6 bacterium GW2011_GWE2_42_60]|nr:MAG: Hydrolase of the alpha/beta superfamily [candidate division TM6 bacterium GW2011_GWE2_42_60]HBY06203.1 hypothetical protein [Candidatus Dependentiae bacterium]